MNTVYETFTLKNCDDVILARHRRITKAEIRQLDVKFLVDTGMYQAMILPEEICIQLGLRIAGRDKIIVDGKTRRCRMTAPIELWWRNRSTFVSALILSCRNEAILGTTALDMLDLAVDPVNGTIFGAHGEKKLISVK